MNEFFRWIVIAAVLLMPVVYWEGGLLELEATIFIRQYLDGRSISQKVFHPHANDFGTYQARELSYFIDYLDAQAFRLLYRLGVFLLVPLSSLISSLIIVVVFVRGAPRLFPEVTRRITDLVLLLYLSNYVCGITLGIYYRSSKPVLSMVLLVVLFFFFATLQRPASSLRENGPNMSLRTFLWVAALGTVMSLLDRMGFFYLLVLFAATALNPFFRRTGSDLFLGALTAVFISLAYNLVVGPSVVQWVNGYRPSLEYQTLAVWRLFHELQLWVHGFEVVLENLQHLLGGFPLWVYATLAVIAFVWSANLFQETLRRTASAIRAEARSQTGQRARGWGLLPGLMIGLAVMSQVVLFALMEIRHSQVYSWVDHRLWYYPLPLQVLLLFLILLSFSFWLDGSSRQRAALELALVAMIAANFSRWPQHQRAMLQGAWFPGIYRQSALVKKSLKQGRPEAGLEPEFRKFYNYCTEGLPRIPSNVFPYLRP